MADLSYNEAMAAFSLEATDYALVQHGLSLDYSPESLAHIEVIATSLHKEIPKGFIGKLLKQGPSESELDMMCKMLGAYVGEVMRKGRGGEWALHKSFNTIGLKFGDDEWVFPLAKVHKRLTEGAGDDLTYFYRFAMDQLARDNKAD